MLKNMKIGVKLAILVLLLDTALVVVGFIGLGGMKAGNEALDTVYNDRVVPLRDLKVIADMYAVNIVDTVHKSRSNLISKENAINNIDEAKHTINNKWKEYLATFLVPEEKALAAEIEKLMAVADKEVALVREIIITGHRERLDDFVNRMLYPTIDPVSDRFSQLIDLQIRVAKEVYEANEQLYEISRKRMIALIIGAALLGAGLGFAIIRAITVPVKRVRDIIDRMAHGDLSVDVADDGAKDEIGEMVRSTARIVATLQAVSKDLHDLIDAARAGALMVRADPAAHQGQFASLVDGANNLVEALTAPLFEVADVMARLASGDIRGRMNGAYEGDLRALKGNVNRSLEALVGLLDEVSALAAAMADSDLTSRLHGSYQGEFADIKLNINKATERLAEVLRNMGEATSQVFDSADETTAAAVDVSRHAARQMETLAEVSSAIEQTVAAIAEISRSAERGSTLARSGATTAIEGRDCLARLTDAVDVIAGKNDRISRISGTIASVADKTYVLALNAGLEAVRAGENGRGFGLIAAKITALAEEAAEAANGIRALAEETSQTVRLGVEAAGQSRTAIMRIVESAAESDAAAGSIAAAIDEQNAMARLLKERVEHLSMVGQTTAGAAEEISATMVSLARLARGLKEETDRIRTI
jgi:methyl-accepting chemotaxis protein